MLFSSSVVRAKIHLHISSLIVVAKGLCTIRDKGKVVFDAFEKKFKTYVICVFIKITIVKSGSKYLTQSRTFKIRTRNVIRTFTVSNPYLCF